MKKLAMILALTFTMGLAASTVNASTVNDEKPKKECASAEKKDCSSTEKKACCTKEAKAACADSKTEKK